MYDQDGLKSIHNHDFMENKDFIAAYERGLVATGREYGWHWRVHIGLWAARNASFLKGDFVECGVNAGFLSSAIMKYLDWDSTGKTFYLLDTFSGLREEYVSEAEKTDGIMKKNDELIDNGFYVTSSKDVRKNFQEWKNIKIIEGAIPETLPEIKSRSVAFLHIDLNCAPPEVAALDYLWDRLDDGAIVLLDDYAYAGYENQKKAMDEYVLTKKGVEIASLPTGQGLLLKHHKRRNWRSFFPF